MTIERRGGGPKSELGKVRSSKNATSHGLTSLKPKNSDEKALIDAFSKELMDYYQPNSPLELLQIERIATCRAKLQYLYELEHVKLALASKEIEAQPDKILDKISQKDSLAKGMAKECILSGQLYLPFRLTQPLLQAICQEITEYLGQIDNKHQFARTFPKLTKFLNEYPVVGLNNSDQWLEKLESVSRQIEVVLRMGQSYTGELSDFVQVYLLGKDYEAQLKREAKSAEIDELDQYIESTKLKHGQKNKLNQNERFTKEGAGENAMPDSNVLNKQLQGFLSLQQSYIEAQRLVTLFHETKELMMRSISLPVSESDLLMRYQTTLERRLSQAIGELLALQKAEK